ncbi:MAG TPA: hypothetical protein VMT75_08530 [Candidatus Saccharimonadales bacterium]|nr:hypothetical protein [Candidatus Saccharimonadales bacterium]
MMRRWVEDALGILGHFAVGFAAKPVAPRVPLFLLLLATMSLDFLFMALAYCGVSDPTSWSHGLFMSAVWSIAIAAVMGAIYRDRRAGLVVGAMIAGHWVLDLVSHPIPFSSFSWWTWKWDYGQPLPPDLPVMFGSSPRMGFGLYNRMSAVEATLLEAAMLALGILIYVRYRKNRTAS